MRVRAVVNAEGGTIRGIGPDAARERLAAAFAENAGLSADLVFTTGGELVAEVRRALDAAHRGEIDAVAVGGGDGSLGAAAGVLAGTGVPFAVLPLGTLNHFARDLGVPTELDDAVALIAEGEIRPVDAAEVNGRVFINNSSIGLYPRMVRDRERQTAVTGRSKWAAMPVALMHALRRFPRHRLWVRAEGLSERCVTPCLFVGNNEYDIGFLTLGRRRHLDAGELCLYIARPDGPVGLAWLALRALWGGLDTARDFEMFRVKAAEIGSHAKGLVVALDGEVKLLRPPLRYRSRPGALRVIAPRAPGV